MIKRDVYLEKLVKSKNNGFPKVITGVRRCGKSFLLKEIYKDYLINNGVKETNVIIIELDDIRFIKYRDPIYLADYIKDLCKGKNNYYVFIDEIQLVSPIINPIYTKGKHVLARKNDKNVITFVDTVLGLSRERNIDLYVTGSNSKMLSSDVATEFRDKATNIHIRPLSFEEFYKYKKGNVTEALYEFLIYGGMPLAVLKNKEDKKIYLNELFETTYYKDILEHNRLRKNGALDGLCSSLSYSCGQLLNPEKLSNIFKSRFKKNIDRDTVEQYIYYFIDAFIINEAKRYDIKGNNEIGALRKYYFVDNGLRNARLNFAYDDEGQMLENLVYNELLYNRYNVNVGAFTRVEKNKNKESVRKDYEIDFIAKKGNKSFYIQVCADLSNKETKEREIKPFLAINNQIRKIIVVNKPIDETTDENGFIIIGIVDFLLRFIK